MAKQQRRAYIKMFSWLNLDSIWWLVLYAVIWLGLGLVAMYIMESQVIYAYGQSSGTLIATRLSNDLNVSDFKNDFSTNLVGKLDSEFSKADLKGNAVQTIRVLDSEGEILYDTNHQQIGDYQNGNFKYLTDQHVHAFFQNNQLLVYVPIVLGNPAQNVGAYEILSRPGGLLTFIHNMDLVIWSFIAISAFLVLGSLSVLIRRATVTIESKTEVMDNLTQRLEESKDSLAKTNSGTVSALLTALDAKDQYTAKHSSNVAKYALSIGQRLGLSKEELDMLETAAILHDIGKIGIPELVLNKRGSLSSAEFALIKRHSEIGAQIVHLVYFLEDVANIILNHHERFDGGGYPNGISGEDIPLCSRILAVSDVYDALTTDRPYRYAMPESKARQIILDGKGQQFDPAVVDAFLRVLEEQDVA